MKKNSFEAKLEELENIIDVLEKDDLDLKTSVATYKKGISIIKECEKELDKARKELKVISDKEDIYA